MNRFEKEVQESLLATEEDAIFELEKQYKKALSDIGDKVKAFQSDIDLIDAALSQDGLDETTKTQLLSQKRSKIYQKQYQEALQGQVSGILDKLHGDTYKTIDQYLNGCYENGFVGTMYSLAGQGIPIIMPIDQAAAVRAVLTDSKVSGTLYGALGVDITKLKKSITQEISRGIASSMSYRDIARNISNATGAPLSRAKTIARTEGHRIQQQSTVDAQNAAKAKGADVVKQWDAALDGRTRPSHAKVDGEIRELDEKFSNGLMYPGDPAGGAAEVCNCRCTSNTRARWALDAEELETLKQRAEYFGLDKSDSFDDFKKKYIETSDKLSFNQSGDALNPPKEYDGVFDDFDKLNITENERRVLVDLKSLSSNSGYEYITIISDGKAANPTTSGLRDSVKVSLDNYDAGNITLLHSHTNATPLSLTDFSQLLNKRVEKIGVICYNGDTYVSYIGNGEIPTSEEFISITNQISSEVDDDIRDDPNFFTWTYEERNYMAIREQAYRIARHFGWTLEGGRIDV